jgi:AraC-like DNA-binding protein
MRYWRIAPDPRLRERVLCYWVVEDSPGRDAKCRFEHGEDLLIPDGHSEIVFNRGSAGFERWQLGAREHSEYMRGSYIIGGRSHSVGTHTSAPLRLAGVKLDSRFLRELIGSPLHEFRDSTLTLRDLGDGDLLALEERIALAASAAQIAAHFDSFLLAGARRLQRPASATDALLQTIHRDQGSTPILDWAKSARVDSRSLERSFCATTGMTPKQYARVIRFKRTYHALISRNLPRPMSHLLDGFYDQSHFNREFRHFTGMAPGAKLAGNDENAMSVTDHLLRAELTPPRHIRRLTAIT